LNVRDFFALGAAERDYYWEMPATARKTKKPRPVAPRYSVAEWYGKDITGMTPEERKSCGTLAAMQIKAATGAATKAPVCPFLSTLIPNAKCHKRGGVCSIRKYAQGEHGIGVAVEGDKIVTTCPSRFIQDIEEGKSVFVWVSEKMLDIANPTIVKETPFLRKLSEAAVAVTELEVKDDDQGDDEEHKAGRIDWIVVNPHTMTATDLQWAAVETQALYFSGGKMIVEFDAYAKDPSPVLFPLGKRRPDYRSSGPKRLSPQLDVKVPVLVSWGKKVAVVIDRFFYENMSRLDEAYSGSNEKAKRDNSTVVWFIVDYGEDMKLKAHAVRYTTLESSRKALNATEPLAKSNFTDNLKAVIGNAAKANKAFKVS